MCLKVRGVNEGILTEPMTVYKVLTLDLFVNELRSPYLYSLYKLGEVKFSGITHFVYHDRTTDLGIKDVERGLHSFTDLVEAKNYFAFRCTTNKLAYAFQNVLVSCTIPAASRVTFGTWEYFDPKVTNVVEISSVASTHIIADSIILKEGEVELTSI